MPLDQQRRHFLDPSDEAVPNDLDASLALLATLRCTSSFLELHVLNRIQTFKSRLNQIYNIYIIVDLFSRRVLFASKCIRGKNAAATAQRIAGEAGLLRALGLLLLQALRGKEIRRFPSFFTRLHSIFPLSKHLIAISD